MIYHRIEKAKKNKNKIMLCLMRVYIPAILPVSYE